MLMSGPWPHGPYVVSKVTYEPPLRHMWISESYEGIRAI